MTIGRVAFVSWIAFAAPPSQADEERAAAQLADPRFAFCHDESVARAHADTRWCEIADVLRERCPALTAGCRAGAEAGLGWLQPGERARAGRPQARAGRRQARDASDHESGLSEPREPLVVPAWLQLVARALVWLLVAAAIGLVGALVVRALGRVRPPPESAEPDPGLPSGEGAADELAQARARALVERDADRLLARAQAAAGRGAYEAAIEDAYAALLRWLQGRGKLELERHLTNGDHLRRLGSDPALARAVREVFADVEQVQFAARRTAPPEAAQLWGRILGQVLRILGRTAVWLLAGSAALANPGCDPRASAPSPPVAARHRGLGVGPDGALAVARQLEQVCEIPVHHRREPLAGELGLGTYVVLADAELSPEQWDRLLVAARLGSLVVIASERSAPSQLALEFGPAPPTPHELQLSRGPLPPGFAPAFDGSLEPPAPAWLRTVPHLVGPPSGPGRARPPLGAPAAELDEGEGGVGPSFELAGPLPELAVPLALLSYGDQVYAAGGDYGNGRVMVLADGSLFTNGALASPGLPSLLGHLARGEGWLCDSPRIEFVTEQTSLAAEPAPTLVGNPRLVPIIAQLGLLALLFVLARGILFGRPVDPPERSRRAFAEHARAIARLYEHARAERWARAAVARLQLRRIREQAGGSTGGPWGLAERIAARTGRDPTQLAQLLVLADDVLEHADGDDDRAPPNEAHERALETLDALVAELGARTRARPGPPAALTGPLTRSATTPAGASQVMRRAELGQAPRRRGLFARLWDPDGP